MFADALARVPMDVLSATDLVAVGLHLLAAVVWITLAGCVWPVLRARRLPGLAPLTLLVVLGSCMALHDALEALFCIVPHAVHERPPGALRILDAADRLSIVTSAAVFYHVVRLPPGAEDPLRGRGLVATYGTALLVAVASTFFPLARALLFYVVITLTLSMRRVARLVRAGAWGPGGAALVPRRADVAIVGASIVVLSLGILGARLPLDPAASFLLALPIAIRLLGAVVHRLLTTAVTVAATVAGYLVAERYVVWSLPPPVHGLVGVSAVVGLVLVLGPAQEWLRGAVDALILRRRRNRRIELQSVLHGLSPERGPRACCAEVLTAVCRAYAFSDAAILLHDGDTVVHGAFPIARLRSVWPFGAPLPARPFLGPEAPAMPPAAAAMLAEIGVVGVLPIVSPRRRWGDLLARKGLLTWAVTEAEGDLELQEAMGSQLARVLDACDLIARAVAVERSLAHAEKLAAIGELAARVAHEIRNPVTAARSLAQQLARGPDAEAATLVVAELDRVERQVAALLRFGRRDELRLAPVDLGALVRATVEHFRGRLAAAGVEVTLAAADGVVACADGEKLRQVLINVVENALDALAEVSNVRHLTITVAERNGTAAVAVRDTGPGVPPGALPRLFDPFFSLKPAGTGLGLAIARRTVEAHGGRIAAAVPPGGGLELRIELPREGSTP